MLKQILADLNARVLGAYKTTLLGILLAAADVVIQNLAGSSDNRVHAVAGVLSFLLMLYRGQKPLAPSSAFASSPDEAKEIEKLKAQGGFVTLRLLRVLLDAAASAVCAVLGVVAIAHAHPIGAVVHLLLAAAFLICAVHHAKKRPLTWKLVGALAVLVALSFAPAARADEAPAPAPVAAPLSVCFDAKGVYCLRPGLAFSGSAYDLTHHAFAKSFQFAGIYELTLPAGFGLAGGASFQTGDVQGLALLQLVTLPVHGFAVGVSELVVGSKASITLTAGSVIHF